VRDASVRRWSAFHATLYRLTGGLLGGRLVDNDMLLLTTTGHVTGKRHTVPLLYLRDGRSLVVIASYGGRPANPGWYDNLVADPRVEVQIGRSKARMVARMATSKERARWWPEIVAAYDGYATYQSRTDREIPVVFLEPAKEGQYQAS
jgi:deazaflavin-dependent oxidoreductase (nitroreductase family)